MAKQQNSKQKQPGYKSDILDAQSMIVGEVIPLTGLELRPKEFSTGGVGFYANGPVVVTLSNGQRYRFQGSVQLAAHNSKEWPAKRPEPAAKPEQTASK